MRQESYLSTIGKYNRPPTAVYAADLNVDAMQWEPRLNFIKRRLRPINFSVCHSSPIHRADPGAAMDR